MSSENNNSTFGLLPVLLTVLFIGLKLTNHIDWSWIWVLSPLWLIVLASMAVISIWFLFTVFFEFIKK